MFQQGHLMLLQKHLDRQGVVLLALFLGEELISRSSKCQVFFSPVQEGLSKLPCIRPV